MGNNQGNYHFKSKSIKVVLVGDQVTEKTKVLFTYSSGHTPSANEYIPTVFDNSTIYTQFHGHDLGLMLWDTSGGEDYDKLRYLSYPDTSVFLVFFSLNDRKTFDNVFKKWVPELWRNSNASIFLIGTNKEERDKDSDNSMYLSTKEVLDASEPFAIDYHELDLKDVNGITNLFNCMIPEVLYNKKFDKKKEIIEKNVSKVHKHDILVKKILEELNKARMENKNTDDIELKLKNEEENFWNQLFLHKK